MSCVAYHTIRSQNQKIDINVPVSEISGPLALTGGMKLGSMMYAEASSWVWADLSDAERIRHVDAIGRQAAEKGFQKVYLTDETKQDLATWTVNGGTKLSVYTASN